MLQGFGAHVLVDGQFGSTGKGLLAAYMAVNHGDPIEAVITNAGPNSGHTAYWGDEKIVLKQLPTFPVIRARMGMEVPPVFISAGAIIDHEILNREVEKYGIKVHLSAQAAVIHEEDRKAELEGSIAAVAGTRQGVGEALANKVKRRPDAVVAGANVEWHPLISVYDKTPNWSKVSTFVEVSQGFSLGINSEFYPKVTSRECTVMQALTDARIHPSLYCQSMMVVRTFPIRVGNVDGHDSGGWYKDQQETTWEQIGVTPETTTVTGRVRRVAYFSELQFKEALLANRPKVVLVNFMNYLHPNQRQAFAARLREMSLMILGENIKFLYGYGPKVSDITTEVI